MYNISICSIIKQKGTKSSVHNVLIYEYYCSITLNGFLFKFHLTLFRETEIPDFTSLFLGEGITLFHVIINNLATAENKTVPPQII
jgi:hypothetical protein